MNVAPVFKANSIVNLLLLAALVSPSAHAYEGGKAPAAGLYPTIRFFSQGAAKGEIETCSGSFVRNDLILTAAHCVFGPVASKAPNLVIGGSFTKTVAVAQMKEIYLHPDAMRMLGTTIPTDASVLDALVGQDGLPDVAFIRLMAPVEGVTTVTIDSRADLVANNPLWIGGYGQQSGHESFIGMIQNQLTGSAAAFMGYQSTYFLARPAQGSIGEGDSGSPVYIRYDNGTYGVVGVASFVGEKQRFGITFDKSDAFARLDNGEERSVPMSAWVKSVEQNKAAAYLKF